MITTTTTSSGWRAESMLQWTGTFILLNNDCMRSRGLEEPEVYPVSEAKESNCKNHVS